MAPTIPPTTHAAAALMNSPLGATAVLVNERRVKRVAVARLGASGAPYETNSSPVGDIYGGREREGHQRNPIERDQPAATGSEMRAPAIGLQRSSPKCLRCTHITDPQLARDPLLIGTSASARVRDISGW